MMDLTTAHRHLVTRHYTIRVESDLARLSVRRDAGTYNLTLHDKTYHKTAKKAFKTLYGALDALEVLTRSYL